MAAALLEAAPLFNCYYPPLFSSSTITVTPCSASTVPNIPDGENSQINSPDRSRDRRKLVRLAWEKLVLWSRSWRSRNRPDVLQRTNKSVNQSMATTKIGHTLPDNVIATADPKTALLDADYCLHAVPVQFSSSFLEDIAEFVDPGFPFVSLSKGLELNTLRIMSQIIPQALKNPRQPFIALSGPSFALELMNKLPTGDLCALDEQYLKFYSFTGALIVLFICGLLLYPAMVVESKDKKLANAAQ